MICPKWQCRPQKAARQPAASPCYQEVLYSLPRLQHQCPDGRQLRRRRCPPPPPPPHTCPRMPAHPTCTPRLLACSRRCAAPGPCTTRPSLVVTAVEAVSLGSGAAAENELEQLLPAGVMAVPAAASCSEDDNDSGSSSRSSSSSSGSEAEGSGKRAAKRRRRGAAAEGQQPAAAVAAAAAAHEEGGQPGPAAAGALPGDATAAEGELSWLLSQLLQ